MRRTVKLISVSVLLLLLLGYVAYALWERRWYLSLIPAEIETSGFSRISGKSDVLAGCGVAVFELSHESQEAILQNGLRFFDSARQARGHTDAYHTFGPWRETPIPPMPATSPNDAQIDAFSMGFSCASLSRKLEKEIWTAYRTPGSYFVETHHSGILVAPASKLVVFSYFD
jgi:hypothetical protein